MSDTADHDGSSLILLEPALRFPDDLSQPSPLWALIRVLLGVPPTLFGSTVSYLSGAQPRWKTLPLTWLFAVRKVNANHQIPRVDPFEWDQPPSPSSFLPEILFGTVVRRAMGCERVIVAPARDEYIGGIAKLAQIKGVPRPGWMIWPGQVSRGIADKEYTGGKGFEKARPEEKVLYYLVGGAYIRGHPLGFATAWRLSSDCNMRLFGLNYRKTINAESAHPAPLLDALAGWIYLVQVVGFCPENIMLVGDSAGGNLCLFLTRYLSYLSTSSRLDPTAESVLGLPCALCLISPWCDLSMQGSRFPSQQANAHADYLMDLDQTWFHASLRYYDLTKARKSVWFSPAMGSPADWEFLKDNGVRVFISYGSAERFMDEIVATAESMRQVGVNVQLYEDEEGIHVCPVVPGRGMRPWIAWSKACRAFLFEA